MLFPYRLTTALAGAFLCLLPAAAQAQQDRITRPIDSTRRIAKGRVHPNARAEDDRGAVDPSMEIAYATLHLKPTAAQQAALEKLLIEQQDRASANYHRWLTPEQYGERFGVSQGDIATIKGWLTSQGMKVNDVARGRRWITFSGTAASVGRGFRTEFHRYVTNGERHFANATVPSVTEALADVVEDVEGLDDYYPKADPAVLKPDFTSSGVHYLAPDDWTTIYDVKPLYQAGADGTGVTIAVLGTADIDLADIQNFRSFFKLPPNLPKKILAGSKVTATTSSEADLDLEWAGAIAPGADIVFVYANSVNTAAQYAVDQNIAPVITESFGFCEQVTTSVLRAIAQQANAQGITWMASSGDTGAAGCERQGRLAQATKGLAVQTPASIPEVTAVGATEFDDAGGNYWRTANNTNLGSAISYIPEMAWNDSAAQGFLVVTGGGASIFYAKPWWQSGPGVPNDNARDVPDVSVSGSAIHDGYLVCTGGVLVVTGGTSAAAPSFAGFVALLNQYLMSKGVLSQAGLGNINPTLYQLAQSAPAAFHDTVKGDNVVSCMQATPDCANGSFGYTAAAGYDLATGLGSIDAFQLASSWTSGTPTTTTLTAAPATVAFNSGTVTLTAAVSAKAGTPTGDVTFLMNDTALGTATLASSGGSASAALTLGAIQFPVGANAITAVYGGAAGLSSSAGMTTVTVTAPAAASAVVASVSPNPVYQLPPVASGFNWVATIQLKNESAVAATLTRLVIGGTDNSSSIINFFGTATIPANGAIATTLQFRISNTPVNLVFAFAGTDASGAQWSQQVSVPFITRTLEQPSILMTTPASVPADPAADPSCMWPEPLVLEEQGGYAMQLIKLTSGKSDFSSQLQQIFGTTTLAAFGRLQGTVCWDNSTATGTKSLQLTSWRVEQSNTDLWGFSGSTTLAASAAAPKPSVSPATVNFSAGSSQKATVSLSFDSGAPQWTAKVSPTNYVTRWLSVSPASGTGAAQLNLTAAPAGLANGVYNATVLIQTAGARPQFTSVPVVLVVGGSSSVSIGGVTNAASGKTVFAPGMLMSVYGTNLAPSAEHAPMVPLPLNMQGVTATVNGVGAPLLDVTPGQLNVQIPYETGAGTAILGVNNNGQVAYFPFEVQASAPGIFMTLDGASNLVPAAGGKRGQIVLAFITGEGSVTPALITGRTPTTADVTQLPAPGSPLTLTVGGVQAAIAFAGIPRGLVGVTQINFTIPANAPLGTQPVVVTVGGVSSAPVNLTVSQ